ncbi:MAG: phosphotransferase, partial [Alphaproteobacteria bacterium]|nr:phosphotransferase [Alphaproteobacteria bacterium]
MGADTQDILEILRRLGLIGAGECAPMTPLAGGVSSDIWRVDLSTGPVCIKRALSTLRVEQDWQVPVERNRYEVAWMETAASIVPESTPQLLAHDPDSGLFVMEYLDPVAFPLWKADLMAGRADAGFAAAVGRRLVDIHAATAGDPAIAARFDSDRIFHDIRLEPYLLATARRHPDRADALESLAAETAGMGRALVHGDVSPKNILMGPRGPIFLDAECAWHGDPAFDLSFCLNHLLLKCLHRPDVAADYLACFEALAAAYLTGVDWEDANAVERRVARLLPG